MFLTGKATILALVGALVCLTACNNSEREDDHYKKARKRTQRMADSLQLDSVQFQQLMQVHTSLAKDMETLGLKNGKKLDGKEQKKLQHIMMQTEAVYREILTQEQYARYISMRSRSKPKRKPDD